MDENGSSVLNNEDKNNIICDILSGNASAETLSQLESLKGSGNTIPTDANEFNSKFVDPSSSDTDDEILDNFNLSCANDKEIEHAILSAAKSGNKQVCCITYIISSKNFGQTK